MNFTRNLKKQLLLLSAGAALLAMPAAAQTDGGSKPFTIPEVTSWTAASGTFAMDGARASYAAGDEAAARVAALLADDYKTLFGRKLKTGKGNAKAGELILQNEALAMLPDWAYELNQNLDWWIAGSGDLINSQGKKLVGANPDGTYILEGDPNAPVVEEEAESAEPEIQLADNEKLGVGNGNGGELTVKVTLDGDAIAAVEILSHNETAGIADAALEQVPAAIVEANSADVDGVSGATMTSNAIKDAVKDALAQ